MTPEQAEVVMVNYFIWLDQNPDGVADTLKATNCFHFLRSLIAADVPGDIVEFGCYQGRTSLVLALTNRALDGRRGVCLFDSFRGLSAVGKEDQPTNGDDPHEQGEFAAPLYVVQKTLRNVIGEYPAVWPNVGEVTLHPGWVEDTLPRQLPSRVAFAYLDLDLYEPTKHSLAAVYDRLHPGAVVLIDDWDYAQFPGATQAVNEFLAGKPESICRLPVPYQAYFVKGYQ